MIPAQGVKENIILSTKYTTVTILIIAKTNKMKRTNYLFLVLALLLTFIGCNQKEKKLAEREKNLALIVDGITDSQMGVINEIIAAAFDLDADSVDFGVEFRNDTLYFIDYNKFSLGERDIDLQKKFLLAALCSETPDKKELFAQIADVPALLQFMYVDTVEHKIYLPTDINSSELKESLSKEYTPIDILKSYTDMVNCSFKEGKLSLEKSYFVVSFYDNDYDIESYIDSLKAEALDEDYYDIINWDNYENKMSKEIQDEAEWLCLLLLVEIYNHNPYIFNEIIKADLGFELRLSGKNKEKGTSVRLDNSDLHELIDES